MKKFVAGMVMILLTYGSVVRADAPVKATETTGAVVVKSVSVEKIAIGTAIENRELSGESKTFDSTVPKVYCWTKIQAETSPVSLKHVWYADGVKEVEVPLTLQSSSGRTWSSKNVWPGSWKVEVVDETGNVLSSEEFTVSGSAQK